MRKRGGLKLRRSIYLALSFVSLIWCIKIVEFTFSYDFGNFGILPRTLSGSLGIITGPLIHGDVYHLLTNTFPVIVLMVSIFYFYDKIATTVFLLIYFMTGFWVWLIARDAYHIGASGLVYGLMSFMLVSGFVRKNPQSLAISLIILLLYGTSFFTGIMPSTDTRISWESHLMGAVAGVFCAIYFKSYGNAIQAKGPVKVKSHYTYSYKKELKGSEIEPKKAYYYTLDTGQYRCAD